MEEFDIKEFAKMFDAALASENPAVKKALKNFMMVAAIVHAEEHNADEREMGPFETILRRLDQVERVARKAYNQKYNTSPYRDEYYRNMYENSPTWVYSPNTSSSTSYVASQVPTTSSKNDISALEIKDILKDLKFDE